MSLRELIREFVLLELETERRRADDPEMLSDDSLDTMVDSSLEGFDRQSKEGKEFSPSVFAANVARYIDHANQQLDISGAVARRAVNHVTKAYDAQKAKEFQRVLADDFGIHVDPSARLGDVDDEQVPTAALGGPPPANPGG